MGWHPLADLHLVDVRPEAPLLRPGDTITLTSTYTTLPPHHPNCRMAYDPPRLAGRDWLWPERWHGTISVAVPTREGPDWDHARRRAEHDPVPPADPGARRRMLERLRGGR